MHGVYGEHCEKCLFIPSVTHGPPLSPGCLLELYNVGPTADLMGQSLHCIWIWRQSASMLNLEKPQWKAFRVWWLSTLAAHGSHLEALTLCMPGVAPRISDLADLTHNLRQCFQHPSTTPEMILMYTCDDVTYEKYTGSVLPTTEARHTSHWIQVDQRRNKKLLAI